MKLEFKSLRVANFAITDKGKFSLAELSKEEFEEYLKLTEVSLKSNRKRQMKTTLECFKR